MAKKKEQATKPGRPAAVEWRKWVESTGGENYAYIGPVPLDVTITPVVWACTIFGQVYIAQVNTAHQSGNSGLGWLAVYDLGPEIFNELRFETESLEKLKLHFETQHREEVEGRLSDLTKWLE